MGCVIISRMTAQPAVSTIPLSVVVAANIRAEAARRGINQSQLGARLGMTKVSMSDRFRCRTPWTLDEVSAVAALFGMPVDALLARPEGFEPPTFWLGASEHGLADVVDLSTRRVAA